MRWLLLTGAAAAAVVLFVVLRPEDDGDGEAVATTQERVTTATLDEAETEETDETETAGGTQTETETAPGPRRIRITVADGRPRGGVVRETVQQGSRVVLVVRADVRDHVHLHGYDVLRDVAPGAPAQLPFTATMTGRFEVELEEAGLPIAQIEVLP